MSDFQVSLVNWSTLALEDLCESIIDCEHSTAKFVSQGFPCVDTTCIRPGTILQESLRYVSEETFLFRIRRARPKYGDIVFAREGTVGTAVVIPETFDCCLGQRVMLFRPGSAVDSAYLASALSSEQVRSQYRPLILGTTSPHLNVRDVKCLRIPIAPLNEQRRIVAKIEELFSDLDAGVAALKRAKANLKRYRAAVLKAAVEGKLTEEWRAKHRHTEPASRLLARILTERRQKWEADQLAKFAAAEKEPPKGWLDKYVEPSPPGTTDLAELPAGWCWSSVLQVCDVRSGQTPSGINEQVRPTGDVPWFKIGDMNREGNEARMNQALDFLSTASVAQLGLHVHPAGTIIFPKRGGAIATNKKRLLAFPSAYDLNTMGLIPAAYAHSYVWTWFQGVDLSRLSDGSNVPQINHQDIEPLPIPMPPLEEQFEICMAVSEKLSQIEAAEVAIDHGLARAARLRQSILKQAFEGKLVSQDPQDEPASVLLERLKVTDHAAHCPDGDMKPTGKGRRSSRSTVSRSPSK